MTQPLSPKELGELFQAIDDETTGKLSKLVEVAGLSLAEDLAGEDFSGADLSEDDLSGINLSGANLSKTNLTRVNLSGANLQGANLREAVLKDVDLSNADLRNADLTSAVVLRVNLNGANLKGSNLEKDILKADDSTYLISASSELSESQTPHRNRVQGSNKDILKADDSTYLISASPESNKSQTPQRNRVHVKPESVSRVKTNYLKKLGFIKVHVKPESVSRVKAALGNNPLNQTYLAQSLELSRDVINRFLNGKPIDYLNAEEICRALNLDLGEITGYSQPMQKFSPKTKLKGLRRHRKP